MSDQSPVIGIIMGSQSDWETMKNAADVLDALNVAYETKIVSAHRTPDRLYDGRHDPASGFGRSRPKQSPQRA